MNINFDDGVKIWVAGSWNDLTFNHYIQLLEAKDIKDLTEIEMTIKIIAAVSDSPVLLEDKIKTLPISAYNQITSAMKWLDKAPVSPKQKKKFLEVAGKRYKLKAGHETSIGEQITLDTFTREGKVNSYELAFGILLREVDEDGVEKEFSQEALEELMPLLKQHVMFMDIQQHMDFFLHGKKTLKQNTQSISITN